MSFGSSNDIASAAPGSFILVYRVNGGPMLGEDLAEFQSILRLDSASCVASHEFHRSSADKPGQPIGTFRTRLDDAVFREVQKLVDAARLDHLPPPTGGGPGTSLLTLEYRRGHTEIKRTFPSRDFPSLAQCENLLSELEQVGGSLNKYPEAAVRVSVEHARQPGEADGQFLLTVANIGSLPVLLSDDHGSAPDDCITGVRVAEFPEKVSGVTSPPLKWSHLALASRQEGKAKPDDVLLQPGQSWRAPTVKWTAPHKNVRYLAQGLWCHYRGPERVNGIYRIRGAAFSEGLEIVPR